MVCQDLPQAGSLALPGVLQLEFPDGGLFWSPHLGLSPVPLFLSPTLLASSSIPTISPPLSFPIHFSPGNILADVRSSYRVKPNCSRRALLQVSLRPDPIAALYKGLPIFFKLCGKERVVCFAWKQTTKSWYFRDRKWTHLEGLQSFFIFPMRWTYSQVTSFWTKAFLPHLSMSTSFLPHPPSTV